MEKKVKAAIIGCGTISGAHGGAYQSMADRVSVAWFCDLVPARAEKRKEQFGDAASRCTADYRDVLNDPTVDVVSVCLPNHLHAPVSIAFLNAGKHVLCEKPAAMHYDEVLSMKTAADQAGRILNIGVCNRFHRSVERIQSAIAAGDLGDVYQIYCSFRAFRSIPGLGGWFTTKALSGGGALIDWGVHFLDLINYCVGNQPVRTVSAVCHSRLAADMRAYTYRAMHAGPPDYSGVYDVEEYVTGLIRTAGPAITFSGAWAQNIDEGAMFVEFMGTKGGIKLDYGGYYTLYTTKDNQLVSERPEFDIPDMYAREIEAFVDAAQRGEKIRSNVDEILITAQMMDAIYRSAETGAEIRF